MNFNKLKSWKQRALIMYFLEDKSYKDIAETLNVPYDTVYGNIQRLGKVFSKQQLELLRPEPTIFVIGDTQCKPTESLDYLDWVGNYIAIKQPDIIVHIGDHYDMASLSSYDRGKLSAEGKRIHEDIKAGDDGLAILDKHIKSVRGYNPRKVVCIGNHEERIMRHVQEHPELAGFLSYDILGFKEYGWEVHDYLKPVRIHGINFVHYLANPMSGKPLGGTAKSRLAKFRQSFVMGHQQLLDICLEPMPLDPERMQVGVVVGACYPFDEAYKGYQGNNHFRGGVMLYEVGNGSALPMAVSLKHMQKKYMETLAH
ncbi:MAG: hypothetical protein [Bacteriophage sp.]|nr:MAG: hypothetical protein [Bacteriophage sp.]